MTRSHGEHGRHWRADSEDVEPDEATAEFGSVPADHGEHSGTAETDSKRSKRGGKQQKKGSFWKELPILIVIALLLTFLIQTFLGRVFEIPSGSMEQTLHGCPGCTQDRILVDKVTYRFTDPSPGDVTVFRAPKGWEESEYQVSPSSNVFVNWLRQFGASIGIGSPPEYDLVKRVIAVGGQTVSCCDDKNRVVVDGKPLDEPYLYWQPGYGKKQAPFKKVTVPKGSVWVMGDNRNNSYDSRYQNNAQANPIRGVVPVDNVIGKARLIIWPPSRWQGVRTDDPQAVSMPAPPVVKQHDGWGAGLPLGAGFVFALPLWWTERRLRRAVRARREDG